MTLPFTKTAAILFILLPVFCSAQSGKFAVNGTVKDSNQVALQFATAGIYKTGQADPLKTTYTNDKGNFKFTGIDTGHYTLVISHTGFTDHSTAFTIATEDIKLGSIALSRAASTLSGVTVLAKKPLIEQTDDKIIYNVENDPATKTETAIEILRKTPFVSVDGDNNVMVKGAIEF
jgi:hypothetical protein